LSRATEVSGVGALLCLLAGAFGVPSLYVPGLTLLLLAAGTWGWVRFAAGRVRLARQPRSLTVEEGGRLTLQVTIERPRLLARGGELAAMAGGGFVPLRSRGQRALEVNVTAKHRGAHLLAPTVLRFRDPFGICAREVTSEPTELLVLPRIERVAPVHLARLVGSSTAGVLPSDSWGEIDGLRLAGPDTRASRIHWASVARTGDLMERRLAPEPDAVPMVVLDARESSDPESLDMAVRAAASLALAFARGGGCSLLLPGDQYPQRLDGQPRGWRHAHAHLALAHPGALAWAQCTRASLVVLVTPDAVPRTPDRRYATVDYVVSPFTGAERRILFKVAGCSVQPADVRRVARAA
jgi:uncharacterized protein (DUF58 family)